MDPQSSLQHATQEKKDPIGRGYFTKLIQQDMLMIKKRKEKKNPCAKKERKILNKANYIILYFSVLLCLINTWSKEHKHLTVHRKVFLRFNISIKKKNLTKYSLYFSFSSIFVFFSHFRYKYKETKAC